MKKKLKRTLFGILVVVIFGVGVISLIGKNNMDRFNPFIAKKYVYALINNEGETDPNFKHRYMYILNGVDKSGKIQEIKVTSSVKDLPEIYIEVYVKGTYVYEYKEISEENVPKKAIKELSNNK